MGINSIIAMIDNLDPNSYAFRGARDDIIQRLRKINDEKREPCAWVWLFSYGEISSRHYKTKEEAENDWARLTAGKAIPLYK